ncbi:MFS transporter [Rhodotorula toruloides]|uniref:MFS transporter n=1 Tax=Rhodotorula toruloides TaxID=5286 RepID=A0A511KQT2_RHOTO|nr:MFS transporter [Rhodotorula toruloides]
MLAIVTLATFGPVALFALWWAAIGGAATSSCFVAAQIWAAPPYLFGPAAIGCTNIPPTISIFLGLLVAGPIANWDVAQQAKRNGGVREPEMRLRVAIAGGVVAAVGNIIYGVGPQRTCTGRRLSFQACVSYAASPSLSSDFLTRFHACNINSPQLSRSSPSRRYFLNSLFQRVGPLKMIVLISIPLYAAIIITVVLIWVSKSTRRASTKFSIMQRE